jgi:hypothetical protein
MRNINEMMETFEQLEIAAVREETMESSAWEPTCDQGIGLK